MTKAWLVYDCPTKRHTVIQPSMAVDFRVDVGTVRLHGKLTPGTIRLMVDKCGWCRQTHVFAWLPGEGAWESVDSGE